MRITGRSYKIAAGVEIDSADAQGVLYAHGGVAGGHSLYVKDGRLRYAFNWVGTHLQEVVADREITPGRARLRGRVRAQGQERGSGDARLRGHPDALHGRRAGRQRGDRHPARRLLPGRDGICVGRDSASPVTPDYQAPFRFTGGTIDKVVVDVSGEPYVDHEAQVRAWFMRD